MNHEQTLQTIEQRLQTVFNPTQLKVIDQSALHAGHAGAQAGGGHFKVIIQADLLHGQSRIKQHRAIYSLLDDLIPTKIHALAITVVDQ
jgi:BolA family transcriptional regulator, general stress-responsive regulator